MPTQSRTTRRQESAAFYPLTREQLAVPSVPLFRLQRADRPAADGAATEGPHAVFSRETTSDFPVSSPERTGVPTQTSVGNATPESIKPASTALPRSFETRQLRYDPPEVSSGFEARPDVRFVIKSAPQINPIKPIRSVKPVGPAVSEGAGQYPYWFTALVQIIIGTIVVILLVKFANLVRESVEPGGRVTSEQAIGSLGARTGPEIPASKSASRSMMQLDTVNH